MLVTNINNERILKMESKTEEIKKLLEKLSEEIHETIELVIDMREAIQNALSEMPENEKKIKIKMHIMERILTKQLYSLSDVSAVIFEAQEQEEKEDEND
ncbi:hypothetical protein FACS1894122_15390 [Alphaproteobacteria bacterium]|nr:hypothetical protein FACS1894122_15390 [Alphaproteobacteria bacterium]